ncbi:Ig-like domain-containing protein [Candidatus Gracilibacteria bacterium]|nr:Ig-like domain-containing protein [Candidatus Gracilibacteria bacterium]
MKSFFKSIFSLLLVCLTGNLVFAAAVTAPLSVTSVKVTDDKHIRINFSEAIDSDSVVLKVMKQSDNTTIKLDAISAIADSPQSVEITLDDTLVEASSYTLTVIAGIGVSGSTITDGASALQDFITPSPLKVFGEEVLNAPSNPNAVLTDPPKTTTQNTPTKASGSATPPPIREVEATPTPTEELPLTGPNSLFFLLLSIPLAYFFLKRKSL